MQDFSIFNQTQSGQIIADVEYMKLAIDEAKKSSEPLPCGVVIVVNGEVIAASYNRQHELFDVTAHAEMLALQKAGKRLGSKNIDGGVIYCTCEPCTMCVSAIIFARIGKIVYGSQLDEVADKTKRIGIGLEEFVRYSPRKVEIVARFMEKECLDVTNRR
jgi:tRNA(adenine34) deaminase